MALIIARGGAFLISKFLVKRRKVFLVPLSLYSTHESVFNIHTILYQDFGRISHTKCIASIWAVPSTKNNESLNSI